MNDGSSFNWKLHTLHSTHSNWKLLMSLWPNEPASELGQLDGHNKAVRPLWPLGVVELVERVEHNVRLWRGSRGAHIQYNKMCVWRWVAKRLCALLWPLIKPTLPANTGLYSGLPGIAAKTICPSVLSINIIHRILLQHLFWKGLLRRHCDAAFGESCKEQSHWGWTASLLMEMCTVPLTLLCCFFCALAALCFLLFQWLNNRREPMVSWCTTVLKSYHLKTTQTFQQLGLGFFVCLFFSLFVSR